MKLTRNSKIFINYFLGPLLFCWLSWSIYRQIIRQPGLEQAWQGISDSFNGPLVFLVLAALLLMLFNWSLEAIKWKISIRSVQELSFFKALQAVFSGVSFSVTTPNRVGEYIGRLFYMNEGNRLRTISITIVGSISQLIITLLAGTIGLLLLQNDIEHAALIDPLWMKVIIYGSSAVLLGFLLFYFRLSWVTKGISRLPGSKRFIYLVEALEQLDASLLWKLLFFSLLRFIVFTAQYYLFFILFDVDITAWQALWTVSVSFLVMAVIPTIAIAELAQRGKVITAIVGLYSANQLGMTLATAAIWFVNLILPALLGSLLILRRRKIISG